VPPAPSTEHSLVPEVQAARHFETCGCGHWRRLEEIELLASNPADGGRAGLEDLWKTKLDPSGNNRLTLRDNVKEIGKGLERFETQKNVWSSQNTFARAGGGRRSFHSTAMIELRNRSTRGCSQIGVESGRCTGHIRA